jgi:hypothetical protein
VPEAFRTSTYTKRAKLSRSTKSSGSRDAVHDFPIAGAPTLCVATPQAVSASWFNGLFTSGGAKSTARLSRSSDSEESTADDNVGDTRDMAASSPTGSDTGTVSDPEARDRAEPAKAGTNRAVLSMRVTAPLLDVRRRKRLVWKSVWKFDHCTRRGEPSRRDNPAERQCCCPDGR